MKGKIWVIRGNYFGYNDEYNYIEAGMPTKISQIYDSEHDARAAYKSLEVATMRKRDIHLEGVSVFCDEERDMDALQKLDDFVYAKVGQHIMGDRWLENQEPIFQLNDDDLFDFINMAELNRFQMVAFDQDESVYVVWLTQTQTYATNEDVIGNYLFQAESTEKLFAMMDGGFIFNFEGSRAVVAGAKEEITDLVSLLDSVIEECSPYGAFYDDDEQHLVIEDDEALIKINPILKQPIFEIRQLTLTQIADIEAEMC